jgi:hypothetical protein
MTPRKGLSRLSTTSLSRINPIPPGPYNTDPDGEYLDGYFSQEGGPSSGDYEFDTANGARLMGEGIRVRVTGSGSRWHVVATHGYDPSFIPHDKSNTVRVALQRKPTVVDIQEIIDRNFTGRMQTVQTAYGPTRIPEVSGRTLSRINPIRGRSLSRSNPAYSIKKLPVSQVAGTGNRKGEVWVIFKGSKPVLRSSTGTPAWYSTEARAKEKAAKLNAGGAEAAGSPAREAAKASKPVERHKSSAKTPSVQACLKVLDAAGYTYEAPQVEEMDIEQLLSAGRISLSQAEAMGYELNPRTRGRKRPTSSGGKPRMPLRDRMLVLDHLGTQPAKMSFVVSRDLEHAGVPLPSGKRRATIRGRSLDDILDKLCTQMDFTKVTPEEFMGGGTMEWIARTARGKHISLLASVEEYAPSPRSLIEQR